MSRPRPSLPPHRRPRAVAALAAAALVLVLSACTTTQDPDDADTPDDAGPAATASASATAPGGAEGGGTPDVAALAGPLADQEVAWEECVFNDDGPPLPGADTSNVECATIQVPRDWTDPDPGSTWDVRISQARNIDPGDPDHLTTILTHPGGPYTSGLSFASTVQMYTPELRASTNYVSFDQRGLGQSSRAECAYSYDPADGDVAQVRAIGEACAQDPEVATMTTEQTAYDMDFIRHLLGLESVTYVGYSYGTWLGTWYGSLFGENIERMVLDSATDSTQASIQSNYDAAHEGRDRQFRLHLMNWIARNDATYGLGTDPEAIWERYFAATEGPEATLMARWAWNTTGVTAAFSSPQVYPFAGALVTLVIEECEALQELPEAGTPDAVEATGRVIDGLDVLSEEQRDAAHAQLAEQSAPPPGEAGETVSDTYSEVIDFTKCTDGQWEQGLEYWEEVNARTAAEAPFSDQLGLLDTPQTCAFWPTDVTKPAVPQDFPETLVLQSELDSMTPFEQGRAAGTGLPNASLIVVDNESVHGVFPYGTDAVDGPVLDFLRGGERPAGTLVVPGKPMPLEETTFESWSPLDADAEHEGGVPRFTDPTVPADTAEVVEPAP